MNEKFYEKKKNNPNLNKRKRDKFIKPLISDEDLKDDSDVFFSVVKNRSKKEKRDQDNTSSYFLSPMRGRVEDRSTFPVTTSRGKIGKQYDFLRQEKKLKEEELKNKFGHEYYEFNLLNNHIKKRENFINNNLSDSSNKKQDIPSEINQAKPINQEVHFDENEQKMNNSINIIYEEDIEIDDTNNIMTSYDDTSNVSFFNDFEKMKNNDQNMYSNINIYEHQEKRQGLKEELKKLFADDDYSYNDDGYYKENFNNQDNVSYQDDFNYKDDVSFQDKVNFQDDVINSKPNIVEKDSISKNKVNFINLKEELDQELHKNLTKKENDTPKYQDLAQYHFPPIDLLHEKTAFISDDTEWIENQIQILDGTLESFGVGAKTVNYTQGPSVTRYEVEPNPGIKVSRITSLQDDIKLRLAASDIRIEAPISGKSTVGIEVPNQENRIVTFREIIESASYKSFKSPLKIALGLDIAGEAIFSDISNMTHSLIAGSTGSGKSVCINSIIISILYNALPDEVKLVLIDPKKVEFSLYRDIPHLLTPVINDPKIATATLRWLTEEMDRRYEAIESVGARDIKSYNIKRNRSSEDLPKLPYIVVIIDELADLMVIAAAEVEEYIQRISQLARAAGIHLIVATQRPSTNVITGTIKTNIPTRISFKVASAIDSRIILDEAGAEKLLGKGDMLLSDNGKPQLKRLQGSFISDDEIEKVTSYVKDQFSPHYLFTSEDLVKKESEYSFDYDDELFDDAVRYVIDLGEASASKIQRKFKVGYNRAARMIDMMEKYRIVGPQQNGSKPRDVLMSLDDYENMIYN
ncbi:DNA translocase FtsK [Mycoplasmatota bacterium]|nr:DNA translocase FtsK [Mycoplasmatota bacterium]